ncbi:hypothetical protein FM037_03035 [Shewanella psychropiezotolerans]|uniref:Uncharacterized protein n=1 Tax=Shewanella psychropiezotolerans TaxID=2593655 RepID=A0ABX5WTI2_9GAMM|nr:hypothetical protein [Shewanella psychropiezotolerans]QDO82404.1 hypothetical protein FM037_03035 [Shewanella psychropiezotolerans]
MTKPTAKAQHFTINNEAKKVRNKPKPKTQAELNANNTRRSIEERRERKMLMQELGLTNEEIDTEWR